MNELTFSCSKLQGRPCLEVETTLLAGAQYRPNLPATPSWPYRLCHYYLTGLPVKRDTKTSLNAVYAWISRAGNCWADSLLKGDELNGDALSCEKKLVITSDRGLLLNSFCFTCEIIIEASKKGYALLEIFSSYYGVQSTEFNQCISFFLFLYSLCLHRGWIFCLKSYSQFQCKDTYTKVNRKIELQENPDVFENDA